jgi:hypothetical protein
LLNLAVGGYSRKQVEDALHYKAGRHVAFRYELLDKNDILKAHLKNVEPGGSITLNGSAQIKRTGRFVFRHDGPINWETDKIKPYFVLHMPDGGAAEWPLGVYYMLTPSTVRRGGQVWHEVEAYDKTVILEKDSDSIRTFFAAGTKYTDAISQLLMTAGINRAIITESDYELAADREWDLGTPKAQIIKTLLSEINYKDIHTDADGSFIVMPAVDPATRPVDYIYKADQYSVIVDDQTQSEKDSFDAPNVMIGLVSSPDVGEMMYVAENTNPASPISIPSRNGRRVVAKMMFEGIASQEELEIATKRALASAAEQYETLRFSTALMPHHGYGDLLGMESAAATGRYLETGWSMKLQAGTHMTHTAKRLVVI